TGTDDATTINTAFSALPGGGGTVYLEEGTYNIGTTTISMPDNTALSGAGTATILKYSNNVGSGTYSVVTNTNTSSGTNVTMQNFLIDGNKTNQTTGTFYGVYLNNLGSGSGSSAVPGGKVQNIVTKNLYGGGSPAIGLAASSNNIITGNTIENNG